MAMSTPDWLSQRGGELVPSKDGRSWSVYFAGQLQYLLLPVPAKGNYGCRITMTGNGKRLDGPNTASTPDQALQGGLTQLREALGW
jgi:hypothetical protein